MNVTVSGGGKDDLRPITVFSDLSVDERLQVLYERFDNPSPIQQYAWPALLAKKDVVGISETGSGKTLAFSLPILHLLLAKKKKKHLDDRSERKIRWVTMAPTRELALQTYQLISPVIPTVCLYGGVPRKEQLRELETKRPVAIVATPGRLQDFKDSKAIELHRVKYLVLDEADRMLDAGFEPTIADIVGAMASKRRQTIMFSATWPLAMQKMALKYTHDFIKITCSSHNAPSNLDDPQANLNISQTIHVIEPTEKDDFLLKELSAMSPTDKAIVFVLYKKEAPRVETLLRRRGLQVRGLHGDLTQFDRTSSLQSFRDGCGNVLVATDVAARGLDIPNVSLVFNYTFPLTVEDYVHRIGRTGRGGQAGRAVTLFTAHERPLAGALQNVLKRAGQPIPDGLLAFGCATKKRLHKDYGAFYRADLECTAPTRITFSDSE